VTVENILRQTIATVGHFWLFCYLFFFFWHSSPAYWYYRTAAPAGVYYDKVNPVPAEDYGYGKWYKIDFTIDWSQAIEGTGAQASPKHDAIICSIIVTFSRRTMRILTLILSIQSGEYVC
jgi:hypothetical protein